MATAPTVGDLDPRAARWMSSNAHLLVDAIPRPGTTWSWSDTDLSNGQLCKLRDMGLIEHVGWKQWVTTERCIRAIADYGCFDVDDVGTTVGQASFSSFE